MAADPLGFCKVKLVYSDAHGLIYPGMEAKLVGTPAPADLQYVADQIGAKWQTRLASSTAPTWELNKVQLIYSNGTIEELVESNVAVIGSLGATIAQARSSCMVVGWQIGSFYRGGKPRTYFPGLGRYDSTASQDRWAAGFDGQYKTACDLFLSDCNAITHAGVTSFTLGCIRRVQSHVPLSPPVFYPYLASRPDIRIGTQRKRLGR